MNEMLKWSLLEVIMLGKYQSTERNACVTGTLFTTINMHW